MCVTVSFQESEIEGKTIKSFLGHTTESLNQRKDRPEPKRRPNRKKRPKRKTVALKPENTSKE